MSITQRYERVRMRGIRKPLRMMHISDIHFREKHDRNQRVISDMLRNVRPCSLIAVTGDLVSRTVGASGISDAVRLMAELQTIAPVVYSLGNHETDLPEGQRSALLTLLRHKGITVLDNRSASLGGVQFTGLTLPVEVFRNQKGYSGLMPVTPALVRSCIGAHPSQPNVLLAHSPMGFPAYVQWGADMILSGHVHGGIVRVGDVGILSPERKFFPAYTKGIYQQSGCRMNVSAGIGKLRICNPAEIVYIDLIPEKEGYYENSGRNSSDDGEIT